MLALAIISFIFYKISNLYFKKTITTDKETEEAIVEQGINTANYKTIIDSTKKKIKDFNTKVENQNKELENLEKSQSLSF